MSQTIDIGAAAVGACVVLVAVVGTVVAVTRRPNSKTPTPKTTTLPISTQLQPTIRTPSEKATHLPNLHSLHVDTHRNAIPHPEPNQDLSDSPSSAISISSCESGTPYSTMPTVDSSRATEMMEIVTTPGGGYDFDMDQPKNHDEMWMVHSLIRKEHKTSDIPSEFDK
ncbi:hypothetical protein BJ741DRAFT_581123 [Chytriomyces cf. hyalinus JEL632]|nr:hypothetical protein BJ741DRAFT_581123 [Chytriomyces cf. hyalinus JEL632]